MRLSVVVVSSLFIVSSIILLKERMIEIIEKTSFGSFFKWVTKGWRISLSL